jgi:chloride channel 3/4/5
MREIVTAASAAGVGVAFGSPIGGVLFSIEVFEHPLPVDQPSRIWMPQEMSHTPSIKTMWRSFFCALMATVTLAVRLVLSFFRFQLFTRSIGSQAMNPFRTGKLVLFQVTYDRDWHFFEIIFFVILGIFGVCFIIYYPYR